jgi:hypothetical protein
MDGFGLPEFDGATKDHPFDGFTDQEYDVIALPLSVYEALPVYVKGKQLSLIAGIPTVGILLACIVIVVLLSPHLLFTVRVTVYVPAIVNCISGFSELLLLPLIKLHPKFGLTLQAYVKVFESVDLFTKPTGKGTQPEYLSASAMAVAGL